MYEEGVVASNLLRITKKRGAKRPKCLVYAYIQKRIKHKKREWKTTFQYSFCLTFILKFSLILKILFNPEDRIKIVWFVTFKKSPILTGNSYIIYLTCMLVVLGSINVKTAEPIGPKFVAWRAGKKSSILFCFKMHEENVVVVKATS